MIALFLALATLAQDRDPPLDHIEGIDSVAYAKGGLLIGGGSKYDKNFQRIGVLKLFDARTGKLVRRFDGHREEITAIAVSPDGVLLASADNGLSVRLWDLRGKRPAQIVQGRGQSIDAIAFSPDGRTLVTGAWDGMVCLRDVQTGEILHSFESDDKGVASLVFTQRGKRLAVAGNSGMIRVWDVANDRLAFTIPADPKGVNHLALSPDGQVLASAGDDGSVRLWEAQTGKPLKALLPPRLPVNPFGPEDRAGKIAFSPDGTVLAAVLYSSTVRLWDVKEGKPIRMLEPKDGYLSSVAFSPDGNVLATGTGDGVRFWDWRKGVEKPTVESEKP